MNKMIIFSMFKFENKIRRIVAFYHPDKAEIFA
jgi:hypothetical protein